SSTLDLNTVLTTIVSYAVQLSGTDAGSIYEYSNDTLRLSATIKLEESYVEALRAYPVQLGEGAVGRAAATRKSVEITDIFTEEAYPERFKQLMSDSGFRAVLAIPLLHEERILGALAVLRKLPGEFPPETIELVTSFATQSALAIENARLFREIEDKSREIEAASRHKSQFLANMSHELRTPLNAIIGFSEVLNERLFGELNDKQAEYVQDIHSSGRHLHALINDILDLSKIEAGRMELELSTFDLPTAIRDALTFMHERANRHEVAMRADIDPRLGQFTGDERKFKQILLNLLSNALKFTPRGGAATVTATQANPDIEISVADTGIGISPADQKIIFEEFRQAQSGGSREGTGLGLTLTRKFVEMHRGKIQVTSEVGKGSTFTFTLPVRL
ncbi:MAG: GAF domain-containing protein, partial [Burkholderiales bacterium]|nr:GAF domain-containing protein [Burkholderiales bacterium]